MPTSTVELQGRISLGDFVKFRYFDKFSRRWYLVLIELAFLLLTFMLTLGALIMSTQGHAPTNPNADGMLPTANTPGWK